MPKPPSRSLKLGAACSHVAKVFDCAPEEAVEYVDESWRFGGLPVYGPSRERVEFDTNCHLDFGSSEFVKTLPRRQTGAITDDYPAGQWAAPPPIRIPVRINLEDLEKDIQDARPENDDTNSPRGADRPGIAGATPTSEPRRPGRRSKGPEMVEAFNKLKQSGILKRSMGKKEILREILRSLFEKADVPPGYSYDTFRNHVGPKIDDWQNESLSL